MSVAICPLAFCASSPDIKYELRASTGQSPALHVKVSFKLEGGEKVYLRPSKQSMLNGPARERPRLYLESNPRPGLEVRPLENDEAGWSIEGSGGPEISLSYRVEPPTGASPQSGQEALWTGGGAPFVITLPLKLFRASDALLLPQNDKGTPAGSTYAVTVRKSESDIVVTPWRSSRGVFNPSGTGDLLKNYLAWGALASSDTRSGKARVRPGFPSSAAERFRKDYTTASGNILSEARRILGERTSMPVLALLALAPSSASPPSMLASAVLPSAKLYGDRGVTASRSVFDLWNRWSLIPSPGEEATWLQEGCSDLYGYRLAVLAGLIEKDKANSEFSKTYTDYVTNPLAQTMSLAVAEKSSQDVAKQLLIDKGAVLCASLGQRLRDMTNGGKDLDWLLGQMAAKYPGLGGKSYTLVDIEEILEDATGKSWARFFNEGVRGTKLLSPADFSRSDIVGTGAPTGGRRLVHKGSGKSWLYLAIGMIVIMMVPVIFSGYVRHAVKLDIAMPKFFSGEDEDDDKDEG